MRVIAADTRTLDASMADKAPKANPKPSAKAEGVLGTLPSTRPERLGAPRRAAAKRPPRRPSTAKRPAAPKPRAVSSGSPELKPHRAADPPPAPAPLGVPKGAELVTTAIRATGELAHIGLVLGGQAVKRTIRRLPHP